MSELDERFYEEEVDRIVAELEALPGVPVRRIGLPILRLPPSKRPPQGLEIVYFIQTSQGLTKIGFTSKLHERIRALRTNCPDAVELTAWVEGGQAEERHTHMRARRRHVRGEWFRLRSHDPAQLISEVCTVFGERRFGVTP